MVLFPKVEPNPTISVEIINNHIPKTRLVDCLFQKITTIVWWWFYYRKALVDIVWQIAGTLTFGPHIIEKSEFCFYVNVNIGR